LSLNYTLNLTDPNATVETVGGKGASLARLAMAGLPVPNGFHISTEAYRRFMTDGGLQMQILAALSTVVPDQPATLEVASRQVGELFARGTIPEDVAGAIRQAYSRLGDGDIVVAVRSSATVEDMPGASFAGQLETFLNLRGEVQVLEGVKRCWASLWTPRALGYMARNGIDFSKVSVAVVVQELVPAAAAGVMFTINPLTGARNQVVINAAWGLGEAVVGGRVTPDTIIVDKVFGKVVEQQISSKVAMTVRTSSGTHEEPVPAVRRDRAVLSPGQAVKLAGIGVRVEELYGGPMDIEWALDRGRFFLVQARPITALRGHNPIEGEWNDSLAGDYLWTRTNYGEAVPDVMTPCTWSFVQILMSDAELSIGPYLVYGNIGGRLYRNLSIEASFAAAFGINPKRIQSMTEDAFGRLPAGLDIPIFRVPRLRLIRMALPVIIGDLLRMRANQKKLPEYLRTMPERCERLRSRIQATSRPEELAALWHTDVLPLFHEAGQMIEAAAGQGGGAIVATPHRLQTLLGQDDANILLTGSSLETGPLASLGPLLSLTRLARGEIDRATYVRQYGYRGPHEAEVSVPRPAEDPQWIDLQLAGLGQAPADATALLARQEAARGAARERLHERYPGKEKSIIRQIDRWVSIARDREAARSEAIRGFWVLRAFVLRAGEITGLGDDMFFLSIDEILSVLKGDRISLAHVKARRASYERYHALPPYPPLIRGHFDPFRWAADPGRPGESYDASGSSTPREAAIKGFPGAAGVVEGRARLVASFEDGDQLQAGEILVTTLTNVGWTPLFPRAAAIVTDVGAPLSHAAIVARELGIPAVVGCGTATRRIKTGDRIRVDGEKGLVELISTNDTAKPLIGNEIKSLK